MSFADAIERQRQLRQLIYPRREAIELERTGYVLRHQPGSYRAEAHAWQFHPVLLLSVSVQAGRKLRGIDTLCAQDERGVRRQRKQLREERLQRFNCFGVLAPDVIEAIDHDNEALFGRRIRFTIGCEPLPQILRVVSCWR